MELRADVNYVSGYLRYGHFEYFVPEGDKDMIKNMDKAELKEYLRDVGQLIIDSYRVEDFGDLDDVEIID